jgi:hypothetical protein
MIRFLVFMLLAGFFRSLSEDIEDECKRELQKRRQPAPPPPAEDPSSTEQPSSVSNTGP